MKHRQPSANGDSARTDEIFLSLTSTPEMLALDRRTPNLAGAGLRRDVRRIASTLFCSADIDPSIVTFAKTRTALHWGLPEDDVDVLVTARLLQKTASLIRDLRPSGADGLTDVDAGWGAAA